MHRRSLLLGAATAAVMPLARPAVGGNTQTLTIVPQVALNSIDQVWTSSQIARNMGFMPGARMSLEFCRGRPWCSGT